MFRLAAMEKGIPLPELPLDPAVFHNPPDPHVPLIIGIVLTAVGAGSMIALSLMLSGDNRTYWPVPLPLASIGLGLVLYYFLAGRGKR